MCTNGNGSDEAQSSTQKPPRVLAVDDEPEVRDIVLRYLTRQGFEVRTAADAGETMEILPTWVPEVILLDIIMPGISGIELCARVRSDPRYAKIPVLFLTGRGSVEDRIRGFEVGGDDYLAKPFDLRELTLRIRALLRRADTPPAHDGVRVGRLFLDSRSFSLRVDEREVLLTPVEFQLIAFLLKHPGEVFSSDQLLQDVWSYAPGSGDPALIRAHIHNLRNKIEPDPVNPIFIRTASRHGYMLAG
jgi:two-component system, OmpR family, response regulator RpaA